MMVFWLRLLALEKRVACPGFTEALRAQQTACASAARASRVRWVITAERQAVIEAELEPAADDVGLGQLNKRRVNSKARSVHARAGGDFGKRLERPHELGTAVRIAGGIEGIHTHEDAAGVEHFGPAECERQENGVARWH